MYIKPLSAIIDSHSILHHSFADDLQLQMSAPPDRNSELLHSMQSCISYVKAWATANMLKLNDSKTELMLVTSKRVKHLHNLPTSITIGNAQIPFNQSVKNLGFTLDCHLTMFAHVSNIVRTCYFELRQLAFIRRFLTSTATATLASAFVLSRIDYCNSLLFGSTHVSFDGTNIHTSIYIKFTDRNGYHQYKCFHPMHIKKSIVILVITKFS